MPDGLKGLLAMAGAATIWGLSGIYYKALDNVPSLEVLCHRILWSAVLFGAILLLQSRMREVRLSLSSLQTQAIVVTAALAIAANWFLFIFSIHTDRALEASLGYYIFPLVAVTLGYIFFKERFSAPQAAAIALAGAAVLVLTVGLGAPPWIALILAGTFGCYGLLKKRVRMGPVSSVFCETAVFVPLVLPWLLWLHAEAWWDQTAVDGAWFGRDLSTTLLLVASGPLTAIPLLLMSYAAQRVSYASMGLVQYLNPTLQFTVAVALFGEPFTRWHAIAFPMIWIALAIYGVSSLRQFSSARRESIRSGTVAAGISTSRNSRSANP
jgi:chloramphenicol-sensitive protein RarD